MRYCFLGLVFFIPIRCYWLGDDFLSFTWFFAWLILGIGLHFTNNINGLENDGLFQRGGRKIWQFFLPLDLPVSHRKAKESNSEIKIYVCTKEGDEVQTPTGEKRNLRFIDLFCVTCGRLISYRTRRVIRRNCSECFACYYPRCYDELVEILWLTKELPWLVESGEFSLYLFGIYHELYSWKIILRDVLKCDKPLRHYDKYLLLIPDFPYPSWSDAYNEWCIYDNASFTIKSLRDVLEVYPVRTERDKVFKEGMSNLLMCTDYTR